MAQEGITNAVKHASDAGGILVERACDSDVVLMDARMPRMDGIAAMRSPASSRGCGSSS